MITPEDSPDATKDSHWCFPDTEAGILEALSRGATHLWANTILFSTHPLQTSDDLTEFAESVFIVGQPPQLVEICDDKAFVYEMMKSHGGFTIAKSATLTSSDDLPKRIEEQDLDYPVIAKPVRGRGSHGVKLCKDEEMLQAHARHLFDESPKIIVEQYLSGEEATVTIMPPSESYSGEHWALPIVTRFNHSDGVAPYNGAVAVTSNSRVVSAEEYRQDPAYERVAKECEQMAGLLKATAPIRIDVRRFQKGSNFALFDVNMKPVSVIGCFECVQISKPETEHDRPGTTWQRQSSQPNSNGSRRSWLDIWTSAYGNSHIMSISRSLTRYQNIAPWTRRIRSPKFTRLLRLHAFLIGFIKRCSRWASFISMCAQEICGV